MRKVQLQDAFVLARIIRKAKLKDLITNAVKESGIITEIKKDNEKDTKTNSEIDNKIEEVGIEIVFTIIDNCSEEDVEKEIYKLIANISEMTEKEIRELEIPDFINLIKKFINENDIKGFFKSATQLI